LTLNTRYQAVFRGCPGASIKASAEGAEGNSEAL
jgi:hypothetical protein